MRGIGKFLAWLAVALMVAGGPVILPPTKASAQITIPMPFFPGVRLDPNYRYRGSGSSHRTKSHSDDSSSTPAKEKDATQDESSSANGGVIRQQSVPTGSQTSSAAPQSSGSNRTTNDQLSFAPSR